MKLPFGWKLTRTSTKEPSPIPTLALVAKARPRASNGQIEASEPSRLAPTPPKRKPKLTNALSGAPDTGRQPHGRETPVPDLSGIARAAGRKSVENNNTWQAAGFGVWQQFTQRSQNAKWGLNPTFDLKDFASMDFDYLAELLADLSPEVSKALWDFINLSNSGYETKAYNPGSEEINEQGQEIVDNILRTLATYHGTAGVFFDRVFKTIFLRGSYLMELVLAKNARDFIDIACPDTKTLEYQRRTDPERGQTWVFGQRINGIFTELTQYPTIRYVPVHPSPDSIEGHPLCSSAFFIAIFLMSVLRDTKRVVQHQGYLRLDVAVLFDKLQNTIPEDARGNPETLAAWMQDCVAAVQKAYESLEPDDTFVHSDTIEVKNPVGTVSSDSLTAIDALFKICERMAVRALKTMPILLGTDQSRSETQANREWEIYAKGIETVQHWVESGFEYLCELACRAQGVQVTVRHRFAQFRAAEAMRDAQVDLLKAKVARYLYDCGYISQDEAANRACGKETADVPEPRSSGEPVATDPTGGENPNPGESRLAKLHSFLNTRQPTSPELDEVRELLREFAPELAVELFDAELATAEEQEEVQDDAETAEE